MANSETLVKEATFNEELSALNWPTHIAVLDEKNIFIRDNYGVHLFDSEAGIETLIEGSKGAGKLTMAVADGKVFAIAGSKLPDAPSQLIRISCTTADWAVRSTVTTLKRAQPRCWAMSRNSIPK